MDNIPAEQIPYRWAARALMFGIILALLVLIHLAWKKNEKNNSLLN
jgi:TRAP-type C4-dicarboxylate transport system permease small subunit